MAGWRPRRTAATGKPQERAQPRVDPSLQSRRYFDARQVGISVVRRLGRGLSHGRDGRSGPVFCEGAACALSARMVHAPERAITRIRIRVFRREPAGSRLGGMARLQDHGRQRRA